MAQLDWIGQIREWARMDEKNIEAYIDIFGLNNIKSYILEKIRKIKSYNSINDRGALTTISNLSKKIEKHLMDKTLII